MAKGESQGAAVRRPMCLLVTEEEINWFPKVIKIEGEPAIVNLEIVAGEVRLTPRIESPAENNRETVRISDTRS